MRLPAAPDRIKATPAAVVDLFRLANAGRAGETAQALESLGLFAIPLGSSKRPLTSWKNRNGKGKWGWTGGLRPSELPPFAIAHGVGLALGSLSGDPDGIHLVCLDADSPGAISYVEGLLDGRRTLTVDSSPGKRHFYFTLPTDHPKIKPSYWRVGGALLDPDIRLDLKADGGYTCLPGTRHPKGHYYTLRDAVEPLPLGDLLETVRGDLGAESVIRAKLYRLASPATQDRDIMRHRVRRVRSARSHGLPEDRCRAAAAEAGWDWDAAAREADKAPARAPRRKREGGGKGPARGAADYPALLGDTLQALAEEIQCAPPGARNNAMYMACVKAGEFGATLEDTEKVVGHAGRTAGLDVDEIPKTVLSGWERGKKTRDKERKREDGVESPSAGFYVHAIPHGLTDSQARSAWALVSCGNVKALLHYADTGEFIGTRTYRCHDPLCYTCASLAVERAQLALDQLWPERVVLLEGKKRKDIHVQAKRLGLGKARVMQYGTPGEETQCLGVCRAPEGKGIPRAEAIERWTSTRFGVTKEWNRTLGSDPALAAAQWVTRRRTRGNMFSGHHEALPSGFDAKSQEIGRELVAQNIDHGAYIDGGDPVDETRPITATVVWFPTKEIIARWDYLPTPLDLADLAASLRPVCPP